MTVRREPRGFTLIEMMFVIAILGLLMALLVPVVSKAMRTVIRIRTEWMLRDIGIGLDMFRDELGAYPPSKPNAPNDPNSGDMDSGAANLVYYLRGPAATGWGYTCGRMPFGNPPDGTYGPYYQAEEALVAYVGDQVAGFLDPIEPSGLIDGKNWGRILYYRAEGGKFIYEHNEVGGSVSERIKEGYANLEHSGLVSEHDTSSAGSVGSEQEGYLLVSPGLDRRYGRVVRNDDGEYEPVIDIEAEQEEAVEYDDIPRQKFVRRTRG
ncbi:MAG TPA: prepilin-type N-terminal cleavage/methylation domain-containing protein [Phycisphaerae bacterium]|nr:prepilin-type N-terminal cleavage/methylation domain-containing protein [Phycisphaerae bacterium]